MVRFERNLAVPFERDGGFANAAAIMINLCLNCHDNTGATAAYEAGGSAMKPFAVTVGTSVAPYSPNGVGNVVDVKSSFANTSASYHPVMQRLSNSYVQGVNMVPPYNMTKTTGKLYEYGYLISCWDCHAPSGASGVLTNTVTAHGAPVELRAPVYAAGNGTPANDLCINCHSPAYETFSGTNGYHNSTSAFGSGNTHITPYFSNCAYCHASTVSTNGGSVNQTLTNRPLRAKNFHGVNSANGWTTGNWSSGSRAYAFFRASGLSNWVPASINNGATSQTATCTAGSSTCSSASTYTPGGAY
jgi:hypothetical protein